MPTATPTAAAHPVSVVITTKRQGKLGTILAVGSKRLTAYLFEADRRGVSACAGACARVWPPVVGQPHAAGVAHAVDLGTIRRADGTRQVTYHGHPLYLFIQDKDAGDAYGEGVDGFGAEWYVINPAGAKVEADEHGRAVEREHSGHDSREHARRASSSHTARKVSRRAASPGPAAPARSTAISIAAAPSGQLAFTRDSLTARAGVVQIHFTNAAPEAHNFTLQEGTGGRVIVATPTFQGGTRTITVQLHRGTYTFFCSVPGHRMAGMHGTLTVS
jgi:predicted lipoprotein with Yx(FWY)xxD motif/plastocyanin